MQQVNYGSQDFFFELRRTKRKSLAIEVHPDSSIQVIAPEDTSLDEVKTRIVKRGQWIIKQQKYFDQFLPRTPEREYVSGETHYYLGKGYLLKVLEGNKNQVKLKAGMLIVTCKEGYYNSKTVKKLLASWYYMHAERKFKNICNDCYQKFRIDDIKIPKLEIKRMSKRWGSCNTVDKITINPEIIKAPTKCIEYLIIHEMCHFLERNHTKRFYNILSTKMPDWERWKDRLEHSMA